MKPIRNRMIRDSKGFSLVELMVTLAISSIVLAGIYGVYRAQLKSHVTQNALVEIEQDLRNALYILQRSIRMAGFDPTRQCSPSQIGLLKDFEVFGLSHDLDDDPKSSSTGIAFSMDANGDQIDPDTKLLVAGAGTIETTDSELIAFRLSGTKLQKYRVSSNSWMDVSENINTLVFQYLNDSGGIIGLPLTTTTVRDVRSVRILITAKQPHDLAALADNRSPSSLTATVQIRNTGL